MQDTGEPRWQSAEPFDPASWVAVSELALEGFGRSDTFDGRVANLRHELRRALLLDDLGRACVPRSTARAMFEERATRQAQAHAREEAHQAELAAQGNPLRDRVRAIQQRGTTGNPLADMKRGDFETGWDRAAVQRDELAAGRTVYHKLNEGQE